MAATATVKQIRQGFVANLSSLGIQSTGYMHASPIAPSIEIFPAEKDYDLTFQRGLDVREYTVRVNVAVGLDVPSQELLDEFMAPSGAKSVKTLIEAEPTLGGKVNDLRVTGDSGHQVADVKGSLILSCSWSVEVYE